MPETSQSLLLRLLMSNYSALKGRLTRRLGSPDIAEDVLQEAYLRVERMDQIGTIQHPGSYLLRVALNIAADRRRSEKRRLVRSEIELLLRVEQDELDPERIAEGRASIRALIEALDELPPRLRAIVVAARFEGLTHAAIAAHFGISTRLVERELKRALDHCRDRLEINSSRKFGVPSSTPSNE